MFKKTLLFLFILVIIASSFILIKRPFLTFSPTTTNNIVNKVEEFSQGIEEVGQEIAEIKESIAPRPTKILENGLPNKYLIKTTFVPQAPEGEWDQPWQDACEEAALLTVDYFYKKQSPSLKIIKNDLIDMVFFEENRNFLKDVNIEQMALIAKEYLNYSSVIIDDPEIEDIKKYLVQNIPVIIPASGKILFEENKHFNSGGPYYHNLTILGFNDDKEQFIVHDVGTRSGAYFNYSYSLLMESIHDFPASGQKTDINSGPKRVLILLK